MAAVEASLDELRTQRTEQLAELLEMRPDPIVLVRAYGDVERFHDADHPCGWARRNQDNYVRMLWGEAISQGKEPCSACGHQSGYEAERRRAEAAST
jgi:hypothetical protein